MPVLPPIPGIAPGLTQAAGDLIRDAMTEIGVLAAGEQPTAQELQSGIRILNQMMDGLNIQRNLIFTQDILDFPYVQGQQLYTLGSGGDFDFVRPAVIERASSILSYAGPNPIEIPIDYSNSEIDWQGILVKSVGTTYPWFVYDDGGMPFRTMRFWPVPNDASNAVRYYTWEPLNLFVDAITPNVFPPGYTEMVRYNLAVRMAGPFAGDLQPSTIALATETLMRIRSSNIEYPVLTCDDISDAINQGSTGLSSDIPPNY